MTLIGFNIQAGAEVKITALSRHGVTTFKIYVGVSLAQCLPRPIQELVASAAPPPPLLSRRRVCERDGAGQAQLRARRGDGGRRGVRRLQHGVGRPGRARAVPTAQLHRRGALQVSRASSLSSNLARFALEPLHCVLHAFRHQRCPNYECLDSVNSVMSAIQ